ncbi:MAG: VWA domain-containing protein, partial [Polyangiales bacterium]
MRRVLDPDGALRVVLELVAVLRRHGLPIAPPEVVDATRALATLGLDDRPTVKSALSATLVKRTQDQSTFEAIFQRFFDPTQTAPIELFERLRAEGFTDDELDTLRQALAAQADAATMGALLGIGGGGDLTRLLRRPDLVRSLEGLTNPMQIGFFTQRAMEQVGVGKARNGMALLRAALKGALGDRGDALADRLEQELERARTDVRDHVRRELERRTFANRDKQKDRRLAQTPFTSLSDAEVEEVRRSVRRLAEKLRGKARVRRKHADRGAVDLRRTLRLAWKTAGVPVQPVRKRKRRDRPRLIVLCDVSDSVRLAARFMLELVHALQELFSSTRSFVFVSELGEVTKLFASERPTAALTRVFNGEAVSLSDNSNYGRVFATFHRDH